MSPSAQLRRILILEAYNQWRAEPCTRTAWLLKLRMEA
jgi:hypothetical protein